MAAVTLCPLCRLQPYPIPYACYTKLPSCLPSLEMKLIILLLIFIQHSDDNSSKDEEMEHKISKEINEVLGKTSLNDPDADIVLTEYLSDGEEAG